MASVVSSSNVFSFKGILPKKDSALLANSSRISLKKSSCTRSRVCVRANYDEFKPEKTEKDEVIDVKPCEPSAIDHLKKAFLGSLDGIEGGVKAARGTRGVISEFISQLESHNPTPVLTQGLPLLNGKWFLVYTTFTPLFPFLAKGDSSLLKVGEISEVIDSENLTSKQSIELVGPLSTTTLSTRAKFEVQSPKRIERKIEEGIIGTPQITDWITSPHVTNLIEAVENMDLFGQKIDLSHFKSIASYIQHSLSALISGASPLKIPVPKNNESWLVVTYLDEELRIERGDGGCEFVFVKEGSLLLAA